MEATTKRTAAAFAALDALYWAGNASGMGFLTAYFLKCGLGSGILSLVIAIFQALSLAGGVFWGNLCDRRGTNQRIFLPVFPACQGILLLIYYFASRNMTLACLLYFAAGFLISSMGTNLDVWIMRSVRYDPASFGVIRGIGSIGYAVSMLATGFLVESFGYSVIVTASYLFAIPTMMLAVLLKEPAFLRNNTRKVSASALLGNRPYIYLVIVILLSGMAVNPVSSLQPVLLESVGGSVSVLGIDMFAAVMFQGLFIMLSGKLARFSPHMRMVLMTLALLAELTCTGLARTPMLIILGMIFSNVSYGIMMPTMRELVTKYVPEDLRNTAHSLTDMIFGSLSGILSLSCSSLLIHRFGIRSIVVAGLALLVAPLVMSIRRNSFR